MHRQEQTYCITDSCLYVYVYTLLHLAKDWRQLSEIPTKITMKKSKIKWAAGVGDAK